MYQVHPSMRLMCYQDLSVVVQTHGVETLIVAMYQLQPGYEVDVLSRHMRSG